LARLRHPGIAAEETDHQYRRLLRARRERPCRSAAEKVHEIAPFHAATHLEQYHVKYRAKLPHRGTAV
jgi:hypothetical protein